MQRVILKPYLFLLLLVLISCDQKDTILIHYSNPQLAYSGRIDSTMSDGVEMYWSGTSIKFNFRGESVHALIEDESGNNYYNVIIDNNEPSIFRPATIKQYYELVSNLSRGKHTLELFKRTEWDRGKTTFLGFQIDGKAMLLAKPKENKRKIEFYGNSITAGYAVEDFSGEDSPDSTYTNNYLSYSAITARYFDAEYYCICRSGIGISISWIPEIMPEIYDRIDPTESTSIWDFSKFVPDIVVVNLLQNDSWLYTNTVSEEDIIDAYKQFILTLRNHYPNSNIICLLGNLDISAIDSKWIDYVNNIVEKLCDDKIYVHTVPYKNTRGHPTISEQQNLANSLIQFIETNIKW